MKIIIWILTLFAAFGLFVLERALFGNLSHGINWIIIGCICILPAIFFAFYLFLQAKKEHKEVMNELNLFIKDVEAVNVNLEDCEIQTIND